MASVTLRADKGVELTWAEVDQNFTNLSNSSYVSVKDSAFGAVGDGVTDDTAAIQAAINYVETAGGGLVYFSPGTYLISDTLLLPSKVILKGESEFGVYNSGALAPYLLTINTKILLADNSNCDMLSPKSSTELTGAGIKNLAFFGNKDNQSAGDGIHLTDFAASMRGAFHISDVMVYGCYGVGIYCGERHNEIIFEHVTALRNGGTGIVIYGQDCQGHRLQSGFNGGYGLHIRQGSGGPGVSGVFRGVVVDCYYNTLSGVLIDDVSFCFFYFLQADGNQQHGIHFKDDDCHNHFIYGCRLRGNSASADGTYSDVYVSSSGASPYNISFFGPKMNGPAAAPQPKNTFYFDAAATKPKVFLYGPVITEAYYTDGLTNNTAALYYKEMINDSTMDKVPVIGDHEIVQYITTSTAIDTATTTTYFLVNAGSGDVTMTLPALSTVEPGRRFVFNKNGGSNKVDVVLHADDAATFINTTTPLPLKQGNSWVEFVALANGWEATGPIQAIETGTTWDPTSIASGSSLLSPAISVPNAELQDFVVVAAPYDLQGVVCTGYVQSAGNVVINLYNPTGGAIDFGSGYWRVKTIPSF